MVFLYRAQFYCQGVKSQWHVIMAPHALKHSLFFLLVLYCAMYMLCKMNSSHIILVI